MAKRIYLLLASLFIGALITCNIIASKFVTINFGFATFTISVGVLPYPITFLITDILSEIYGRKKTNEVVYTGFIVSLFVLFILWLGQVYDATPESPITNDEYNNVFQNSTRIILASMVAYLAAQLIDVRLFHFWKKVTKGKHLWIRNNFSTIISQFVDTLLVVFVLFIGVLDYSTMSGYVVDGWLFKALIALVDTVFIYLAIYLLRKYFKLKPGQEIEI